MGLLIGIIPIKVSIVIYVAFARNRFGAWGAELHRRRIQVGLKDWKITIQGTVSSTVDMLQ
jgi:hypothetical protein